MDDNMEEDYNESGIEIVSLKDRLTHITIKDLAVVLLCAISVYLVRVRDSYSLKPMWRHDFIDQKKLTNEDDIKLPSPIITDIESDGVNEVIFITNDLKLMMLAQPRPTESIVLPHMDVKFETVLPVNASKGGKTSHPVAMTTGYLEPYQEMGQIRKQVIVVVTDDWHVMCFNHELRFLWQAQLMDVGQVRDNYFVKAMSVSVNSYSIKRDDSGSVLVGGSYGHKHHQKSWSDISAQQGQLDDESRHAGEEDSYTHFSTYALSGSDGSIRWHHLPGDFDEQKPEPEDLWSSHHWKLSLKKGHLHAGESHWSKYHDDILTQLPHSWHDLSSTSLNLARFTKSPSKKTKTEDVTPTMASILGSDHIMGFQYGGLQPHSKDEHVGNPNAVVIQNHDGIEVLNLQSGQPMTRISLPDEKTIYTDINNDGKIDQIKTSFSRPYSDTHECNAIVMSLPPNAKTIFTGPICETPSMMGVLSHKSGDTIFYDYTVPEDLRLAVPPIAVKSVAKRSGILNHIKGYNLLAKKGYDSLYFTSHGKVTSYGPSGEFHWQVTLPTKWAHITHVVDDSIYADSLVASIYQHSFQPSMKAISLLVYGREDILLTSGWSDIALTDLQDGHLMAEHSLPCKPSATMVTGDYNNDGRTDIIVSCSIGYIGFSIESESNIIYTILLGMLLLLIAFFLTWLCTPDHIHAIVDNDDL
ncbi:unnamed protein product [Owenia fusiformis]|uniref:Uncharacterized protein n=1 Tax=Owenia fusiformis TaxID=6347 RepID=A0A8J1TV77_OWEFU|nr:unnamed protein product [Owenia fusiformis]